MVDGGDVTESSQGPPGGGGVGGVMKTQREVVAAVARACRRQGAAVAYERDVYAWKCEDYDELLPQLRDALLAAQAEIDRLESLKTKLLRKCNELLKASDIGLQRAAPASENQIQAQVKQVKSVLEEPNH